MSGGEPSTAHARAAWRTLGAVASVLILFLAGVTVWGWLRPEHNADRHFEHAGAVARVTVRTGDGDVTVQPGSGRGVTVDSHLSWTTLRAAGATVTVQGDSLQVAGECPTGDLPFGIGGTCRVDVVVHVPAATPVEVTTEGGDVQVADLSGGVSLSTAAGDVDVHDLSGDLSLRSDAGTVDGSGLRSPVVHARLDAGDLTLTFAAAPTTVTAVADAGDVTLALARGSYQVHAQTDSGSPEVDVANDPEATSTVTARAGAGSMRIRYAG